MQNDIWIAVRTDGNAGTGTIADPYDGSTAAKLGNQLDTAIAQAPVTIHLAPGVYGFPWKSWTANGVRIVGEGKYVTIVRNSSNNPTGQHGWQYWTLNGNNNEVRDIEFDCNSSILSDQGVTAGAVVMKGSYNYFRRVYVTAAIGNYGECFPLRVAGKNDAGTATIAYGSGIEDCEVANFIGASATLIMVSGGDGTQNNIMIDGYMINNYVHDSPTVVAYGAAGTRGLLVEHNRSYNTLYGYNRDTHESTGTRLADNTFLHCHQYGIVHRGGTSNDPTSNDSIENNFISVTGERSDSTGIAAQDSYQTKMTVHNNTVIVCALGENTGGTDNSCTGTPGTHSPTSFDLYGGAGWDIEGNHDMAGFLHNIHFTSNATIRANIDDTGALWIADSPFPLLTKNSNYTATFKDHTILVDTTSSAVSITLPATSTIDAGKEYVIKDWKGKAGTRNITVVTTLGALIDGAFTKVINTNYGSLSVKSDGTNWSIIF